MNPGSPSRFDVIVIGAGANGLVAAAALGRAGLNVLLLEERDETGGQARTLEFAPGFRVALVNDGGWVPSAVTRGLKLQVERAAGDVPLSVPAGEREFLTLWSSASRTTDGLRKYSTRDAAIWPDFAYRLHRFAGLLAALYQLPAPDIDTTAKGELLDLFAVARRLRRLGRRDMTEFMRVLPMSVQELADDAFEFAPLKALIAASGVRSLRQGPRSGGSAFVLLHHLIGAAAGSLRNIGWWRAGPDAFQRAAEASARQHKVTIRSAARVAQIQVRDNAVTGVVLANGEEIAAPRVLSTTDPARTLLGLVDPVWLDPEFLHNVRNIKMRGSTAYVAYALDAMPELPGLTDLTDQALTGMVSITSDSALLERAADAAKYGQVSEQPHVEFFAPTQRWPDSKFAPAGRHVLLATARYAPYELNGDAPWDATRREALADRVTSGIEAVTPCFSSRVLHRATFTPRDIENRFGLTEGAFTQGELMLDQILFMRPVAGYGRYHMPIGGLYLGGAGTHPGPGILGGPGWLAAAQLLQDRGKKTKAAGKKK